MKSKVVLTQYGKIFLMNQKKKASREEKKQRKLRESHALHQRFHEPVMQGTSRRFMETLPTKTLQ